jgi:TrmH family RNA methyltransferase
LFSIFEKKNKLEITSVQNPKVKLVSLLQSSSKLRKENNSFVVEGKKEFNLALKSGYTPLQIYICAPLYGNYTEANVRQLNVEFVSELVYQKMAFRGTTEGIIAVFEKRELLLKNISLKKNPIVLVLEGVEKPGNLGAILRSADAAGIDAVIVCDTQTDFFNPNVIRASIGCFFSVQSAICTNDECLKWLNSNNIKYYSASLDATKFYHEQNLKESCAFVMGTEANGLSIFWQQNKENLIKIPMLGKIDSLNVSVSAALLCYEAQRQRNFS